MRGALFLDDLIAEGKHEDPADLRYVVRPFCERGAVSMNVGKPWGGKSTGMRAMALCVADDRLWLGKYAVEPGPVCYVSLDDPRRRIVRSYRGLSPTKHPFFLYRQDWFAGRPPTESLAELADLARFEGVVLIVIDTFHSLFLTEDVNAYGAVNDGMLRLETLAERSEAHVTFSHHARKGRSQEPDPEEALGSQAFRGKVDAIFFYSERAESDQPTYYTLRAWSRDGPEIPETTIRLQEDANGYSWPTLGLKRAEVAHHRIKGRILDYVAEQPEPPLLEDVVREVQGSRTEVRKVARRLIDAGRLNTEGEGKRGDPYRLRVPAR